MDEIKILERMHEIRSRMNKIEVEAPMLARALDEALAKGNTAQAMFCRITMASRLNELNNFRQEVDDIQKSLGIL